jgi:hypothetical protein
MYLLLNVSIMSKKSINNEPKSEILLLNDVNKIEVVDEFDRSYIKYHDLCDVRLSFSNDGKTLKINISKKWF